VDLAGYFERELADHLRVAEQSRVELAAGFRRVVERCRASIAAGGKLLFFGNGGSAADAQHFAAELVVRYRTDRPAVAAIALTTDTSILTAGANDLGYEQVFARQIEALGRAGDVAVGSSTSGTSPNVLAAFRAARRLGLATVGLTGARGAALGDEVDELIVVPSENTARIQEMHLTFGHLLCGAIEAGVGASEVRR